MAQVAVGAPSHAQSLLRYSYPITLRFKNGSQVALSRFYSDFVKLRTDLITKSSRTNVPVLPPREWDGYVRVRERRRIAFEYFLNWCLTNAAADIFVLEFFRLRSLSPLEQPQISLSETLVDNSNQEQGIIKLLFFSFLWLVVWQAMAREKPSTTKVPEASSNGSIVFASEDYIDYVHAPPPPYLSRETTIVVHSDGHVIQKEVHEEFAEFLENNAIRIETVDTLTTKESEAEMEKVKEELIEIQRVDERSSETVVHESLIKDEIITEPDETPKSEKVTDELSSIQEEQVGDDEQAIPSSAIDSGYKEEEENVPRAQSNEGGSSVEAEFAAYLEHNTTRGLHNEEMKTERKQELEFFFTPFHGLVAFIALYIFVIIWTKFFPATNSLHEGEGASDSDSITTVRRNEHQQPKSVTSRVSMGFAEASEVFKRLQLTERETQFGNSLLARATGGRMEESSVTVNKSLSHLWDEASVLPEDEARERFVAFVLSRVRIGANASSSDDDEADDDAQFERSLNVLKEAPPPISASSDVSRRTTPEDSPSSRASAIKWWDSQHERTAATPQRAALLSSPIPVVDASSMAISSFDSTDVSSLSISPSPVRALPSNQRAVPQRIVDLSNRKVLDELKLELGAKGSTETAAEFAMGTVLGLAGAMVASTAARKAFAMLRG